MTLFPQSGELAGGRAVLLSIKPRFADQILARTKKVEFRRSWANDDVGVLVLYSSAPTQKLVGVAYVDQVVKADTEGLWQLACSHGGGLEKDELVEYFEGKDYAFGILLRDVRVAKNPSNPEELFPEFRPPQSYQYLSPLEYQRVMAALFPGEPSL